MCSGLGCVVGAERDRTVEVDLPSLDPRRVGIVQVQDRRQHDDLVRGGRRLMRKSRGSESVLGTHE